MVPVNKRVAASLYYMSDEGGIRKVANAFGIVKSTVSIMSSKVISRWVTKAISIQLAPKYIQIPRTEEAVQEIVINFFERYSFPRLGAVDGTQLQ